MNPHCDVVLAEVLAATGGATTEKALRGAGMGYTVVRRVIARLDALGLTRRERNGMRVLAVPLAEALTRVAGETVARGGGPVHCKHEMTARDIMYVRYDPGDIFRWPQNFPAAQVLGRNADDDPDRWYIGMTWERRKDGRFAGMYVYDGERVVEVGE